MVWVIVTMLFLLVMGGLAVDYAYVFLTRYDLNRTMDAASLAAAGNLGFDDTAFPGARQFAQLYATKNPLRGPDFPPITFTANPSNDPNVFGTAGYPYGDVILGVWDPGKPQGVGAGQRFEPSLDGTMVNAVLCRYKTTVPTNLFRLWGMDLFRVASHGSIAIANPPRNPPPIEQGCLLPIGVGSCPFQGNTSQGCGVAITFITSSGEQGDGCLAPPCSNTAAWVSLDPNQDPNASYLPGAIQAAGEGNCQNTPYVTGDSIETNNGMVQPVMNAVEQAFLANYDPNDPVEIKNADGDVIYSGPGWKVYVPVIQTECPTGAISGGHQIVGWTQFVMTQVINRGECAVANHEPEDNAWDPIGRAPNCHGTNLPPNSGSLRAVFGYFACGVILSDPVLTPTPRTALGTRLRLVN
jgi:hypothetical protein